MSSDLVEAMSESDSRPPVPAATVALVRENPQLADIEVLLLRRDSKLVFHGGHWVFPGGRIDREDYQAQQTELEYPAARQAAVRETWEEAGIRIEAERLIHLAHWTTPPKLPRRFSTWFFVCPLTEPVEVQVDDREIRDYRWSTPSAAIELDDARQLVLPRPTRVTLEDLQGYRDLRSMIRAVTEGNIRVFPENSSFYRPSEMGYQEPEN